MHMPYSIKYKRLADETSGPAHHDKLARIAENTEIIAMLSILFIGAHHGTHFGADAEIRSIIRAWLKRATEEHREEV